MTLINFTEQDNLQGSPSGSIGVRGKQDGLGRGAGSVTRPSWFKRFVIWISTDDLKAEVDTLKTELRNTRADKAQLYKRKCELARLVNTQKAELTTIRRKLGQYEGRAK